MIDKKKIIFLIIIIICLIRVSCVLLNNNDIKKEENKKIVGIITDIKKGDNKTTIDIKEKNKYRITLYKKINLELGDKVLVNGKFNTPDNNTVFNGFNYRKYLLSKGIKMISNNPSVKLISKNNNILYTLKNKMIKHSNKYKSKAYIKAFVLGKKDDIDIMEDYRKLGISHLFSISGMHVSLFLFVLNFLLKKVKLKNMFIFIFLLLLNFLTGFTESLLRCTLFIVLSFINKKYYLKLKNIHILILTLIILLFYRPYFIYSIGFCFSFIITFYIILFSKYIKNNNYFVKLFKVSLICFLSSIPLIIYSFYNINLLTILFNMIFVPIISVLIFPLGIITFLIPQLDNIYLFLINILEYFINILSSIDVFYVVVSKPNIFILILYYLFLYLFIKINKKFIIVFILIFILNLNSKYFIRNTSVTFLNVNQGDSAVIILPKGKTVLIDTGGRYFSDSSIIKTKLMPFLNSKGINNINVTVLTHGDYDHMGEAINLVNNFKVEKVIFNCGPYNDLEQELIKVLDKKKIKYYSCIKELNIDNNKLYFLQTKEYDNENDNSNVIYTELNGYKFMFMGDASSTTEKEIMNKYNLLDIDVLKVGHHGSKTSSGKEFISEINPKYSIISVGKNNRYGHPNKEVLYNLKDSKIYRTDQDGSIMFKIKNKKLKIETCSP